MSGEDEDEFVYVTMDEPIVCTVKNQHRLDLIGNVYGAVFEIEICCGDEPLHDEPLLIAVPLSADAGGDA